MIHRSTSELKCRARGLMAGNYGFLALVTFCVVMIYLLATRIVNFAFPASGGILDLVLGLACSLLVNIIYSLFCAGQASIYLNLCRGQQMRLGRLLAPFSGHPEPVALFALVQFAVQTVSLNALDLAIPRIAGETGFAGKLPLCLGVLALILLTVWFELGLGLTLFVYCDNPRQSGVQLLRKSWQLVHGSRCRLLYLLLSFAGVMLLSMLSAGIGLLFALPYLYTVQALFYLNLRSRAAENQTE